MRRLIFSESGKNFFSKPMLILIVVFLLVNAVKINYVAREKSPFSMLTEDCFREAYEDLYAKYKGELTAEKLEGLRAIYEPLNEKVSAQTYSKEAEEGCMTFNTFSDYLLMSWCFMDDIEYETEYKEFAKRIVSNAVENVSFYKDLGNLYEARCNYKIAKAFHERELTAFHNTDGFRCLLYYDFSIIMLLMLIVFGCTSVFVKEKETEMNLLLRTSVKGQKETFWAKIAACVLFAVFICGLFSAEDYILFYFNFGNMDALFDPVYTLVGFKQTLLNVDLIYFFGICVIDRIIGAIVVSILCMICSLLGKNSLQVIFANIGILAGLVCIYAVSEKISRFINPLILFYSRKLYMRQGFINIFGYPVVDSIVIYAISSVIIVAGVLLMRNIWKRG